MNFGLIPYRQPYCTLHYYLRLSDPRHFDHILPFLCPEDIPHRIDLSADDICTRHEEDGDTVQRMPLR